MAEWRRRAWELFPEYAREFGLEEPETTIYWVFFDLLPLVRKFHDDNDTIGLSKIYEFAEWCLRQGKRAKDLRNAAGVAFYEHLVDSESTLKQIPQWVKPWAFEQVMELFEARLDASDYSKLLKRYDEHNGTKFELVHQRDIRLARGGKS
jgi:hypothetical protein